ncbi:MAG: EamA family transporter [Burkholderiaceae bacterium]
MTLPIALLFWQTPNGHELMLTALAGVFGTLGHWCLTRSFSMADVSAVQPVRFLDLVWSSLFGIALFGDTPTVATLVGGTVVVTSTIWLARSESRARRR